MPERVPSSVPRSIPGPASAPRLRAGSGVGSASESASGSASESAQDTIRFKVRLRGEVATVRALIRHPMETGFRVDLENKQLVSEHYITHVIFTQNGRTVLHCDWSRAVSKNPYLSFMFSPARPGDVLRLSWVDNLGRKDSLEEVIPAA